MSLGNVYNPKQILKELASLSPEEAIKRFQELIEESFVQSYGRYESGSGRLFAEIYHHGDTSDTSEGSVVFRSGEVGSSTYTEDLILPRPVAIRKFMELLKGGFELVFKGIGEYDIQQGNIERENSLSPAQRDNILGIYKQDKRWFRLNQFGDAFTVERGTGMTVTFSENGLSEESARLVLAEALEQGFAREGEKSAPTALPKSFLEPETASEVEDWEEMI